MLGVCTCCVGNGAGPGADRDQTGQWVRVTEAAGLLQKKEVPGPIRLGSGGAAVPISESAPALRDTGVKRLWVSTDTRGW
jgi:hypothetical protein